MWNSATLFVFFFGINTAFVLISSEDSGSDAVVAEGEFFRPGFTWCYKYTARAILNEKGAANGDVGFLIGAEVDVSSIWGDGRKRILKINVKSPKLFIRSKSSEGNPFVNHESSLDQIKSDDFFVSWNDGTIEKIFYKKESPTTIANLYKGVASLFQFQLKGDLETVETDASGKCNVLYLLSSIEKFKKVKANCASDDLPSVSNPEPLLSTKLKSFRTTDYELNGKIVKSVKSEEIHESYLPVKDEIGNKLEAHQTLLFDREEKCDTLRQTDLNQAKQKLFDDFDLKEDTLLTQAEENREVAESFGDLVGKYKENLKSQHLGKITSAKVLIPLLKSASRANKAEITKVLNAKKHQKILPQLYDVLGYAQTADAHQAAMKKLHFDDGKEADNSERYLWASSLSTRPNPEIVNDLLNKFKKTQNVPRKLQETLILSVASMAGKLSKLPKPDAKLIRDVQESIVNGYDAADKEDKPMFLRALKNLRLPSTLPKLLEVVKRGNAKEAVLAWKAIRALTPDDWSEDVLSSARRTYYQIDKKHDSSSRTLAAEVILGSNPSDETLRGFLYHLLSDDKQFEVKQYVYQLLRMLSDEDPIFKKRLLGIIKGDRNLNNYSTLSPKGLSIALKRKFFASSSSNGSLITIQEMSGGIVKRGTVDVVLDKSRAAHELFSLGIFSGGLGSFLSSDDNLDDDSAATAGMELAVLGTQIRPFTFFEGQGELMGHVWSGTASERTTAFHALILAQDDEGYVRLGAGFVAEVDAKGAASFDLAGRIEMSLWSRNAQSLIEKSVGYVAIGSVKLRTGLANLAVEYRIAVEPNLLLNADIDFSSDVALCMRLSQPETIFRHNVHKIENVPESKHTIRRRKLRNSAIPGRTYALNRKNDQMCSAMFK